MGDWVFSSQAQQNYISPIWGENREKEIVAVK